MLLVKYTAGGAAQGIALDASISETHTGEVRVTDSPVERGVNISDHARRRPATLKVEAIVSDWPLEPGAASASSALFAPGLGRSEVVMTALRSLRDAGALLEVVAGGGVYSYENVLIESITETRDKRAASKPNGVGGVARRITIGFREVRLVDTAVVPIKRSAAAPLVAGGKKDLKPASEAERRASILSHLDDYTGGQLSGLKALYKGSVK